MKKTTENSQANPESRPTVLKQDESYNTTSNKQSPDYEQYLYTGQTKNYSSGRWGASERVNMQAFEEIAQTFSPQTYAGATKLNRKERREKKNELKAKQRSQQQKQREATATYKTIKQHLKERDKELSGRMSAQRAARKKANDVVDYLGYNLMYQDGICEVEEGLFSETIAFEDISYHSAREDIQKSVFSSMCSLYDSLSADTLIQLNIINTPIPASEVGTRQFFDPMKQESNAAAADAELFNDILNAKLRQGVSNIRRERYFTFSVAAETAEKALPNLARIEASVQRTLGAISSSSKVLNGAERLQVLSSQLKPLQPFFFDYATHVGCSRGMTTKDSVAPCLLDFNPENKHKDCFKTDGMWGQVLVMRDFASDVTDQAISKIVNLPIPLNVTLFIQPIEKNKYINETRQKLIWMDKEIIDEQRMAVNQGFSPNILPHELKLNKTEAEGLLDDLQNKNQRSYSVTGLVYTYAPTKERLTNQCADIISAAQSYIAIDVLDSRQKEGLNSVLPLGHNHIDICRGLTTAEVSIFMPFATQELNDEGGIYYGQNKHSSNLVLCNRKKLTSPMGFICGKTGAGKGMFCKAEMTEVVLSNPTDEIYIIDRAGEYTDIVKRYGGSVYNFAVGSETYLNPFDTTSVNHLSRAEQIAFKTDAVLAQAGASATESGQGLSEVDQSIISRCVGLAFATAERAGNDAPPLLEDFYEILKQQPEPEAEVVALRYERFVKGSMSFFNHHTNVDFNTRIVDFNLKELPDSMLVFGLINVCEAVRNRMYQNRERNVRTWLYIEEMQSMFAYPTVLNYFSRFSNEGRKFGMILTGITQNASAIFNNKSAQNIVTNADFIMLLKQSPLDRKEWMRLLNLSDQEIEAIDESAQPGDGLLIAGAARVPIRGNFPSNNALYDLFSTNPNEVERATESQRF